MNRILAKAVAADAIIKGVTYRAFNGECKLQVKMKADIPAGDNGYLEGYLAVFNNVDLGGDMIVKGAFSKTIRERVASGKVPLMVIHAAHGGTTTSVVGKITEAREDDYGLFIHAEFSSTPLAQEVRTLVFEKMVVGLSIGYQIVDYEIKSVLSSPDRMGTQTVCILKELKLMEGTITPFPMNESATITKVKTDRISDDTPTPEGTEALNKAKEVGLVKSSIAYYEALVLSTKSVLLLERSN